MEKLLQNILLKKKHLLLAASEASTAVDNTNALALLKKSFNSLGFELDRDSYQKLSKISGLALTAFYRDNYELLSYAAGANVTHKVFYGNFPDFSNMSDLEIEVRRIISYLTFTEDFIGVGAVEESSRPELSEETKYTVLSVCDEKEAREIIVNYSKNYLGSKQAIPDSEKSAIKAAFNTYSTAVVPETFEFRETFVWFVDSCLGGIETLKMLKEASKVEYTDLTSKLFKTATDVLRFYAIVSRSDIELIPGSTKFKSLKRSERKLILEFLNNIAIRNKFIIDDLASHKFLWLRAAELLHSGEYTSTFPEAQGALSDLRNGTYQTFNSKVEEAISNNDIKRATSLLKMKPGYFARSLDYLCREFQDDIDFILEQFKSVLPEISSTVIYQLIGLFNNRQTITGYRIFKLKKNKLHTEKDNRKGISMLNIIKIVEALKSELERRYSDCEKKKVYLSDSMSKYMIPENARLASAGLKTLTFGSRLSLDPKTNIVRLFVHWKNFAHRPVDIDLSVEFFNEKMESVNSLSWHNITGMRRYNCFHSGDIRTAPNGASEFVDLDLSTLANYEGRYAAVSVCAYSSEPFRDIPECFAGFMERQDGNIGELFEPRTVKTKFDLASDNITSTIMVVDLKKREVIWTDFPLGDGATVASVCGGVALVVENALKTRLSLKDLVQLHKGHLEFITKEDALKLLEDKATDVLIIDDTDDATLTPYDIDEWSTWL